MVSTEFPCSNGLSPSKELLQCCVGGTVKETEKEKKEENEREEGGGKMEALQASRVVGSWLAAASLCATPKRTCRSYRGWSYSQSRMKSIAVNAVLVFCVLSPRPSGWKVARARSTRIAHSESCVLQRKVAKRPTVCTMKSMSEIEQLASRYIHIIRRTDEKS